MANYNGRGYIQVTDVNGDTAEVSFPLTIAEATTFTAVATDVATMATALEAVTNGKVTRQGYRVLFNEAQYLVGTSPPTDAEYSSVTDGAHLSFATGTGLTASITVPAPVEAVFGADSNVVDSTEADMAAFIAAFKATAEGPGLVSYNLYKGGIKVGRHSRRRVTKLIP